MNRVELVGRLSRDPLELRRSANGTASIRFTLAVDRRAARNEEKSADFIPCVAFNKTAEFIDNYVKKGLLVSVEGHVSTSDYEKDGKRVYVVEVTCDNIQILEPKGNREAAVEKPVYEKSQSYSSYNEQPTSTSSTGSTGINIDDDDLNFL